VITRVGQHKVGNVSDLLGRVASLQPGQPAPIQVWRAQGLSEVTVMPGQRPATPRQRR